MSNISDNIKNAYKEAISSSFTAAVSARSICRTLAKEKAKALHEAIAAEGLDFSETCNELKKYYEESAKRVISNN